MNKIKGLTIQFIPYGEIERLNSTARIKKLLEIILKNKIIVLQGRLTSEEETRLIEDTMIMVDKIKGFRGIELAVVSPNNKDRDMFSQMRYAMANALVGQMDALTVIGPAAIIKDMKRDPKKLEIFMSGK